MSLMSLQRAVFIFAIFLCCFRSCLCVDCTKYPYHRECRGIMTRLFNPGKLSSYATSHSTRDNSHYDCSTGNCKPKIKYLLAFLDDIPSRQDDYSYYDYETPMKRKLRSE